MRSATGSWRRHGSNDRFVARNPWRFSSRMFGAILLVMGPSNRTSLRVSSAASIQFPGNSDFLRVASACSSASR